MIQLQGLQKVIQHNTVIDFEALTIKAGEIAALVGPAGSGKQALLELLLGSSQPTAGTIQLAGVNPHEDKNQLSHLLGVLFAEDSVYKYRSPRDNLVFFCRLRGLPKTRADEVLSQVGLADHARARVDKLPSGLARRLAFGLAILHQPRLLILVEPFARCDDATISLLSGLIRAHSDEGGAVLILAVDEGYLSPLCDTIYTLNKGRIVTSYQPQDEQSSTMPFKIPARLEGKVALLNPADILYADAAKGRAFLQTTDGRYPTQFTLGELEERLARSGFFRAHRSYLVNLQHVKEVIPYTRNSFSLRLNDAEGTKIPLSKSAAAELKELLGY